MQKYKNSILADMTSEQAEERQAEEIEYSSNSVNRLSIAVRNQRDRRLAETDWMANSDVTMSDNWRTYRQALRDLPAQSGFPDNVTWPTEPS